MKQVSLEFINGNTTTYITTYISGRIIKPVEEAQIEFLQERLGRKMYITDLPKNSDGARLFVYILYYHKPSETFRVIQIQRRDSRTEKTKELCSILECPVNDINEVLEWITL